jgi:hypothetical protein
LPPGSAAPGAASRGCSGSSAAYPARLLAGTDAAADTAHAALEHLAGQHVEDDRHLVAGIDVAEVVLGQVGADPQVVVGDQRHRRRARLGEMADIGAQVGDDATAGATTLVRARSSSAFLDRRARAAQLRVVVAALAGGFLRLAQVGLGGLFLAARLDPVGLRDLQSAHRDGAGVLGVESVSCRVASLSALTWLACAACSEARAASTVAARH